MTHLDLVVLPVATCDHAGVVNTIGDGLMCPGIPEGAYDATGGAHETVNSIRRGIKPADNRSSVIDGGGHGSQVGTADRSRNIEGCYHSAGSPYVAMRDITRIIVASYDFTRGVNDSRKGPE